MTIPDSIFRAYDIRGIVGETLEPAYAEQIGRAFATTISRESGKDQPKIAVGMDGRESSPAMEEALVEGLKSAGAEIIRIGVGPTPMLYFTVRHMELDGGVMVTGSHNPPAHNGFKLMKDKMALFGDEILALAQMIKQQDFNAGEGHSVKRDIREEYLAALLKGFEPDKAKKTLKVAWDAGNGAAGEIMARLCAALPGEHITLYEEIDSNFPNHHPDPSVAENLQDLIATVTKKGCDFGVAFDGDGDRIGVVDGRGRILWGDQLMVLYAQDVLANNPGATVIADVKASQMLFDKIAEYGGNPVIWKTGHSLIKSKMAELDAALAGEMSGHIFFADRYYGFDDGLYAAVRLLNLAAQADESVTDMMSALPVMHNTPELRIECREERKFAIIEEVKARLEEEGANVSDIDGVRVMNTQGWWLLRASNTQAALVARCEAKDEAGLDGLRKELKKHLKISGITLN